MSRSIALASVVLAAVSLTSATVSFAARPADTLLPSSTKAFISIPNVDQLTEHFNRTPLGRLLDDPIMRPFRDDLHRQLHEKGAELKDSFGVSIKDIEGLASGEVALAVVKNQQGKARLAAVVDVTDNLDAAKKLLEQVDAHLVNNRNAKRTDLPYLGIQMRVYDVPAAARGKPPTQGVYFFIDGQLGIASETAVAQEIIQVATGKRKDNLTGVQAYQACLNRSSEAIDLPHQLAVWVDPVGLADSLHKLNAKPAKKATEALKIVKKEGFDAIQGIGGHVNFGIANYGVLYRVSIYAPGPYQRAMRMLSLPNGGDFTPQSWVPRKIAGYTTFKLDALNAFDNFGTLFDSMFGEGESVWPDVLDSLKNDPNGPKVDLRNDVVAHLNNRGTVITDNTAPIGPHSQRRMIAVEGKDEKALAAAIDRLMRNDKSVKVHEVEGIKLFEIIPETPDELPELNINEVKTAKVDKEPPPHGGVAVAHGHLFIASHYEFVRDILNTPQSATPLFSHRDYQQVQATLKELAPEMATSIQGFSDDYEVYQATYEMFRQGRLAESSVPLAKLLNSILNDPETGKTWKQLDGTKLPPISVLKEKNYGGIGGGAVTSEANGWLQIGFTLDRNAPQANTAGSSRDATSR